MRILHLSDIHFGRDNEKYKIDGHFDNKEKILENLLSIIDDMQYKPDHIIMTGDIAWHGKKSEFEEALTWFKRLLTVSELTADDISFCPGNHDVNRGYVNYECHINTNTPVEKMDEFYKYCNIHRMESPLENYNWFCHQLGVIPYDYPCEDHYSSSYSVGYRNICTADKMAARIFSFNTALFSALKDYPDDRNLIGQPQIIELQKYNLLSEKGMFRIAIFHHAERFLHPDEISEYNLRKASLPLLRDNVDLVLCGHTETGGKPVLYHQDNGAYMLTAGAAYYDDKHPNSFSIIELEDRGIPSIQSYVCEDTRWKQMQIKKDNIEKLSIQALPIAGEMKGQGSFTIISGDRFHTIPISNLKLYMLDENHGTMDNKGDPTRLLDITASGPTNRPGKACFSVKEAPEKEYSVEAMLERERIFDFLNEVGDSKQKSRFEMRNPEGIVFFSGDSITCDGIDSDKAGIEILEKLRFLEEKYDIRFKCPLDVYTSDKEQIDLVVELLRNEYYLLPEKYTIATAKVGINDQNKIEGLYKKATEENSFYLVCKDSFICKLVERSFELGIFWVVSGPYTVDKKDIKKKSKTFINGDTRTVEFLRTKETKTYLISGNEKLHNSEKIRMPCEGSIIQIQDMKIDLGFIKEQMH